MVCLDVASVCSGMYIHIYHIRRCSRYQAKANQDGFYILNC